MDYELIKNKMVEIIKEASLIMKKPFSIKEKGDVANIVTSNDIAVQNYLVTHFKELIPECGFLCEEDDLLDLNHQVVFIIDPIDGTENYSRSNGESCISVALVENKKAKIGIVYNPYKDELYEAILNNGAFLNNKKINVSNRDFHNALLYSAYSVYRKEFAPICADIILETFMQIKDFRRAGTAALELCYLASGKAELYFEYRLLPWDYAAASLILKETGGYIKTFNSDEVDLFKPSLIMASNSKESLDKFAAIISKHVKNLNY